MDFKIVSDYQPTGDQPNAIKQLVEGINQGTAFQTLLGVTGSGKTFSIKRGSSITWALTLLN